MQHKTKEASEEAVIPMAPLHGFRSWGGPISVKGTILLILCGFNISPSPPGPIWRTWPRLGPIRNFLYFRIKSAAFPVSLTRQLGYAAAFLSGHGLEQIDMVLCQHERGDLIVDFPCVKNIYKAEENVFPVSLAAYDTIIVSYPDPLGLGWNNFEKRLLRETKQPVLIINGRGRILSLTPEMHRLLCGRRFLALTRLFELLFGFAIVPLAVFCALKDKFTGRFKTLGRKT